MIAVLISSRNPGSSGRVSIRSSTRLVITGLEGERKILAYYYKDGLLIGERREFEENGEFPLLEGADAIAVHLSGEGKGRVSVDLI